ncbi:MAG: M15 family metallopeptidase [Candidatus Paceibacterota bacterium]
MRQKKENEEIRQRLIKEELAREQAKRDAEKRIYLMGKFDPAQREDFAPIPTESNIGGYKMYLRKEVLDAFLKMQSTASVDKIDLKIASATRNFDYQKNLWNNKWTGIKIVDGKDLSKSIPDGLERFKKILEYSSAPGTSRHHWGTDIDINGAIPSYFEKDKGKEEYEWLVKNAYQFGFCQTYNLKGSARPTGYNEEKWHWSYMPLSSNFLQEYKNLIRNEDIKGFFGDEYVSSFNLIGDYVLSINPDCI